MALEETRFLLLDEGNEKIESNEKKRLAIVGSAPRSQHLAPYTNPDYEIWGLNYGYKLMPRFDRWFELHDLAHPEKFHEGHYDNLKKIPEPIYVQKEYEGLQNQRVYPLAEVIEYTGSNYFTNSISYMIALAIFEGFKHIEIYGVDMAVTQEYREQRPSCEFWIGLAIGLGITVLLPDSSDLCKTTKLYAFNLVTPEAAALTEGRKAELEARLKKTEQELLMIDSNYRQVMAEKQNQRSALAGALEELNYMEAKSGD